MLLTHSLTGALLPEILGGRLPAQHRVNKAEINGR